MPLSDFDTQIQCEEYYDEPDYWNADYSHIPIDEWESDHFDPDVVWDDDDEDESDATWYHDLDPWGEEDDEEWVRSDGSTGPAGEAFLASLTPEDFV